jgi:NADPH-dependent 2,4-dienoyl-CoA reductase/sulfur reductase-like enzyme
VKTGIVDDNPSLGGQIWRGASHEKNSDAHPWLARLHRSGAKIICGTKIVHHPHPGRLLGETFHAACELGYEHLVLATGARERLLPFPGWTLPNVMGAGGLQALVKSGLPISGKRVVVAGTGPLLLAVAAYLRKAGAHVPLVCEQASWTSLAKFAGSLLGQPQKIWQGLSLRRELGGASFVPNCWPIAAEGDTRVEAVVISKNGKTERIPCDYLACGFYLLPNSEMAKLLGCQVRENFVVVDEFQQTSVSGIYCAGEPTGIAGVEASLVEGQIAGLAASGKTALAEKMFQVRDKWHKFRASLNRAFALRAELRDLPRPETIVCRCEDVPFARMQQYNTWRNAKLQTRSGMGPCQGRICGSAAEFLFGWDTGAVRPPLFPAQLGNLAAVPKELKEQPLAN